MKRLYVRIFAFLFPLLCFSCSHNTATSEQRFSETPPLWNLNGTDFTGISSFSGPSSFDRSVSAQLVPAGGLIFSNIIVDNQSRVYVATKTASDHSSIKIHKLRLTQTADANEFRDLSTLELTDDGSFNINAIPTLTIDRNNYMYTKSDSKLIVLDAQNDLRKVASVESSSPEIPVVLDSNGHLYVVENQDGGASLKVYSTFSTDTAFTPIKTLDFDQLVKIQPLIVGNNLFLHTANELIQIDITQPNIMVVTDRVSVTAGIPHKALVHPEKNHIVYEYHNQGDSLDPTEFKVFNVESISNFVRFNFPTHLGIVNLHALYGIDNQGNFLVLSGIHNAIRYIITVKFDGSQFSVPENNQYSLCTENTGITQSNTGNNNVTSLCAVSTNPEIFTKRLFASDSNGYVYFPFLHFTDSDGDSTVDVDENITYHVRKLRFSSGLESSVSDSTGSTDSQTIDSGTPTTVAEYTEFMGEFSLSSHSQPVVIDGVLILPSKNKLIAVFD